MAQNRDRLVALADQGAGRAFREAVQRKFDAGLIVINGAHAMGVKFSSERRLLAEDELDAVQRSHYPQLEERTHSEVVGLVRYLRARRDRARDLISDLRRARRGKGSVGEGLRSERGLAAKKQVYARALKRVNARMQIVAEIK